MAIAYMDPNKITAITLHCAATPEGRKVTAQQIIDIGMQRFGQPSYHYYYDLDGHETQLLRHDQRGAHVAGGNTGNIGMCYGGGVAADGKTPKDTRTPAQKVAMERRLKLLHAQFPNAVIKGHGKLPGVNKACPSFDVPPWLREIGIGPGGATPAVTTSTAERKELIRETQVFLNRAIAAGVVALPKLDEDGLLGAKTSAALTAFRAALLGL